MVETANAAAAAVGVRVAGVDMAIDGNGQPQAVFEVNTGPGLHWHVLVDGDPYDPFVPLLSREF